MRKGRSSGREFLGILQITPFYIDDPRPDHLVEVGPALMRRRLTKIGLLLLGSPSILLLAR